MEPGLGLGKRKSRSRRESPAFFMFDGKPVAPRVAAIADVYSEVISVTI
jgi:hypothetical protein